MPSVIVVGAGLAGLTAARYLHRVNWTVTVLDARDQVGGRIQTDCVDGFLLDHGFQVYLTGYETAGNELNLDALQLGSFPAGALVQWNGHRYRVCDPLRSEWYKIPLHALETALAPVGSIADKLRIASFRHRVCRASASELVGNTTATAKARLEQMGFSPTIIDRFFRPFFGGIFLDDSLSVSAGIMEFVFRTFSLGLASLPAQGMQAIPKQIASGLPADAIQLGTTVRTVEERKVFLSNGDMRTADYVIVATEEPAARRLLNSDASLDPLIRNVASGSGGHSRKSLPTPSTCCLYFEVEDPPMHDATLVLNGQGDGLINNLCFPNFAQPSYAPPGKSLLSVSTIGQNALNGDRLLVAVREQLVEWFGPRANAWRHLRTYSVPYALPNQSPTSLATRDAHSRVSESIWRCGDYCETGSIEGAIRSGLATAKNILSKQDGRSSSAPSAVER